MMSNTDKSECIFPSLEFVNHTIDLIVAASIMNGHEQSGWACISLVLNTSHEGIQALYSAGSSHFAYQVPVTYVAIFRLMKFLCLYLND